VQSLLRIDWLIPEAALGVYKPLFALMLQLPAQIGDVHLDDVCVRVEIVAPNPFKNIIPGLDRSGTRGEILKKYEFSCR